jgi:hypothetical protein
MDDDFEAFLAAVGATEAVSNPLYTHINTLVSPYLTMMNSPLNPGSNESQIGNAAQ